MQTFAERLRAGDGMSGLIVKMAGTLLVELTGLLGFDVVVIDTEHGPSDGYLLEHHLLAAAAVDLPAIVRVAANDGPSIQSALDLGATGIIVPHVSDAEAARRAVSHAYYPPVGERGLALTTRAARHGTVTSASHIERSQATTVLIVQIEDPQGAEQAGAIAAVAGVDGVWIGPNDLAAAMGRSSGDSEVLETIASISHHVQAAGTPLLDMCGTPIDADRGRELGASVHLFTAHSLVVSAGRRLLDDLRDRRLIEAVPSSSA